MSKEREGRWFYNKFSFDSYIAECASHCPNMTGEDDMRDLCEGRCSLYSEYCVSLEPSSDCLDGSTKNEV